MTARAASVALLAAAVALLPARSPGCAIVPPTGQWAGTVGETAVLIWDAEAGVEHFVRSATFHGSATDFGFLVPTPTRPATPAEAPGPITARLELLTAPRTVTRRRLGALGLFPQTKRFTAGGAALPPAPPSVQVVERARVGDLDAAVLKATDAEALRTWLGANGYAGRPELTGWLQGYVDDGWHLTAFKVADPNGPGRQLTPVRLSFPTVEPVYPYQEPADAAGPSPTGWRPPRLLRLFVLAPWRAQPFNGLGRAGTPAVQVRPVYADRIDRSVFEATAAACGLPAAEVAKLAGRTWTVTEFEDQASPRPPSDLSFRPDPDQSSVERPPTVVYEDIYWPYPAGAVGFTVGLPLLLWAAWRFGVRRLLRQLPAAPLD